MAKKASYQPRETSWHAPHFIHFEKGNAWFTVFTLVALITLGGAIYFKQWLLAGVVAAGMLAIYTYANERPTEKKFQIDSSGISVGNRKYKYDQIKSFWIAKTPESKMLYLDSVVRLMPPILINLGEHDEKKVRKILLKHLPEEARSEILLDRINRWLRF